MVVGSWLCPFTPILSSALIRPSSMAIIRSLGSSGGVSIYTLTYANGGGVTMDGGAGGDLIFFVRVGF